MKPSGKTPVFIAMVVIFGGLVACNCVGFPPAPPVKAAVPGNPAPVSARRSTPELLALSLGIGLCHAVGASL